MLKYTIEKNYKVQGVHMKKRILAMFLCVLMVLPCFAWAISADDGLPTEEERVNIAPNGKTYHTSIWNQDGSARFLNNGVLYSSWQFWRPGSVERPDTPGIDDTLQHTGMKFNNYYSFNEVVIYAHKYADRNGAFCGKCGFTNHDDGYLTNSEIYEVYKKDGIFWLYTYKPDPTKDDKRTVYFDEDSGKYYKDNRGREELEEDVVSTATFTQVVDYYRCKACDTRVLTYTNQRNNIKFTVKVLVQGKWIEAGHAYNNDMEYVIQGEDKDYQILGEDLAKISIKLDKVLPAYNEDGDIIVDENGEPIYSNYATTKNVRIEYSEYGAYALRGATSDIKFNYDDSNNVTSIVYKNKTYNVAKDEEAAIPTYRTTYYDEETKADLPLVFTINEKFGGAEFSIVQAEKFIDTGKLDDQGEKIYHSSNRDRYLFDLDEYKTNGKIKITQALASTHDWWLVPLIQEVEIMGAKTVNRPKFDVPEGAEVVSDAALGGMAGATTSELSYYPLLGNDKQATTRWQASDYENQSYWIDFTEAFRIKELRLNFGAMPADVVGSKYVYDVYVKVNGEWELIAEDKTATAVSDLLTDDQLDKTAIDKVIEGVKVTFTSSTLDGENVAPTITEVSAPISDGKQCIFLSGYLDFWRASSTAQGNLACYGEAYCSSSFDYSNVSDINFIIDGQVSDDSSSWFANDFAKGTYCGVKLKDTEDVTKVVLYFNDAITGGKYDQHVMDIDVEALVDGKYVKVADGTSYDTVTKKPIVSIEFDAVRTNDIRIVYQSSAMVFPFLKELEVYAGDKVYTAYDGYMLDLSTRTLNGRTPTMGFADKTVVFRSNYMNLISPKAYLVSVETLVLAMSYGIDISHII